MSKQSEEDEIVVAFVMSRMLHDSVDQAEQSHEQKVVDENIDSEDDDSTYASSDADATLYDPLPQYQQAKRDGKPITSGHLVDKNSPFSLFSLFLTPDDVQTIVLNTNKYAQKKRDGGREWEMLSIDKFY